jgi:glucose/arabinose dehydrogenase
VKPIALVADAMRDCSRPSSANMAVGTGHASTATRSFSGGRPSGKAEDVVTGFLNSDEKARGRPVGLAVDKSGALLIADDVGNAVWRVTPAGQ